MWFHFVLKTCMYVYNLSNGNLRANLASASTHQNGLFQKYARLANICRAVLQVLARLANICQTVLRDSPDSPRFAKPFCEDSPDSRKASLASVMRIWQVWRVWKIWRVQARPFYTYKICYLCRKRHTLSCALWQLLADSGTHETRQTCRHLPSHFASTHRTRRLLPNHFARTRQTRQHSPKAIFEKNVTCLAKFARVIHESREFGTSSHCLL